MPVLPRFAHGVPNEENADSPATQLNTVENGNGNISPNGPNSPNLRVDPEITFIHETVGPSGLTRDQAMQLLPTEKSEEDLEEITERLLCNSVLKAAVNLSEKQARWLAETAGKLAVLNLKLKS